MVYGVMVMLCESRKTVETLLNIFARPNIIKMKNLHRAGIEIDYQGVNMDLYYYSILSLLTHRRRVLKPDFTLENVKVHKTKMSRPI